MDEETREQAVRDGVSTRGEYTQEVAQYSIGSNHWPGMAKVIEEMGELQRVMAKIMSTGGEATYWDGTNLVELLLEELADVEAALWFFMVFNRQRFREGVENREHGDGELEDWDWRWRRRVKTKQDTFMEWHRSQCSE